jgi:hypothetical protein
MTQREREAEAERLMAILQGQAEGAAISEQGEVISGQSLLPGRMRPRLIERPLAQHLARWLLDSLAVDIFCSNHTYAEQGTMDERGSETLMSVVAYLAGIEHERGQGGLVDTFDALLDEAMNRYADEYPLGQPNRR